MRCIRPARSDSGIQSLSPNRCLVDVYHTFQLVAGLALNALGFGARYLGWHIRFESDNKLTKGPHTLKSPSSTTPPRQGGVEELRDYTVSVNPALHTTSHIRNDTLGPLDPVFRDVRIALDAFEWGGRPGHLKKTVKSWSVLDTQPHNSR